jgi:hypothetical protein
MGDAAPHRVRLFDIGGMQEFTEDRAVDDAIMGALGNITDDHIVHSLPMR